MADKDSYWFRHDAGAGRGLKILKMFQKYKHWGKGVYWDVIEILRSQADYKYENTNESLKILAGIIGCSDKNKFIEWLRNCIENQLFIEKDGYFYSDVLSKNMINWEVKKSNGSKAKRKLNGSESISETEAKSKDKSIGDNITEQIEENKQIKNNLIDQYFKDLPNSIDLETYCMRNNKNKGLWINRINDFKPHAKNNYPNFDEFFNHYRSWVLKNPTQSETIKAPSSFNPFKNGK